MTIRASLSTNFVRHAHHADRPDYFLCGAGGKYGPPVTSGKAEEFADVDSFADAPGRTCANCLRKLRATKAAPTAVPTDLVAVRYNVPLTEVEYDTVEEQGDPRIEREFPLKVATTPGAVYFDGWDPFFEEERELGSVERFTRREAGFSGWVARVGNNHTDNLTTKRAAMLNVVDMLEELLNAHIVYGHTGARLRERYLPPTPAPTAVDVVVESPAPVCGAPRYTPGTSFRPGRLTGYCANKPLEGRERCRRCSGPDRKCSRSMTPIHRVVGTGRLMRNEFTGEYRVGAVRHRRYCPGCEVPCCADRSLCAPSCFELPVA